MEEIISFVVVLETWAKLPSRFTICDSLIFRLPWAYTLDIHPTDVSNRRSIRVEDPDRTNLLCIMYPYNYAIYRDI